MTDFDRKNVVPIRQLPGADVRSIIDGLPSRGFTKVVVLGQTEDGYWNFQFGGLTGKVEVMGVLEFMKVEIWDSMREPE